MAVRKLDAPLRFAAPVVTGFQRGSKQLGWPTANLQNTPAVQAALEQAIPGVYCGWARCARHSPYAWPRIDHCVLAWSAVSVLRLRTRLCIRRP